MNTRSIIEVKTTTLFKSITMFFGNDSIPWNIHTFNLNMENVQEYCVKYCQSHITPSWI